MKWIGSNLCRNRRHFDSTEGTLVVLQLSRVVSFLHENMILVELKCFVLFGCHRFVVVSPPEPITTLLQASDWPACLHGPGYIATCWFGMFFTVVKNFTPCGQFLLYKWGRETKVNICVWTISSLINGFMPDLCFLCLLKSKSHNSTNCQKRLREAPHRAPRPVDGLNTVPEAENIHACTQVSRWARSAASWQLDGRAQWEEKSSLREINDFFLHCETCEKWEENTSVELIFLLGFSRELFWNIVIFTAHIHEFNGNCRVLLGQHPSWNTLLSLFMEAEMLIIIPSTETVYAEQPQLSSFMFNSWRQQRTFTLKWISTNFPKRLLLLFRTVFAFPKASSSGFAKGGGKPGNRNSHRGNQIF